MGRRRAARKVLVGGLILAVVFGLFGWAAGGFKTRAAGSTYYVAKSGNNADGQTWETAWNELDQINWGVIQPGDTIYLDGGSQACPSADSDPFNDFDGGTQTYTVRPGFDCGVKYETTLTVGASGVAGQPISIKLANEPGHNGTAVIFGGRTTPLPYCLQPGYTYQTAGVRAQGINVTGQNYVTIDGNKWGGLVIYGHNTYGMTVSGSTSHITVRNLHIFDNGLAYEPNSDGNWSSDNPGVNVSGSNNTFERMIIHDNGQDAFQSSGGLSNFTLRQSWLYNGREHPVLAKATFNYCRHSDGVQIFDGDTMSGVVLEQNVIGPRLMQGYLLGDTTATVNDVVVKDSLIFGTSNMSVGSNSPTTSPTNWRVENVTSVRAYDPELVECNDGGGHTDDREQWNNLQVEGTGHVVKNSIFYGGCTMSFSDTVGTVASEGLNNCVYGIKFSPTKIDAVIADPMFSDAANFDFSLDSDSQCEGKGSPLTSVSDLFNTYPNDQVYTWRQTDWSGGSGQANWSDTTKFSSQTGINIQNTGQISLSYTDNNSPSWYNFDWGYRKKITINHGQISGTTDLTNFPVLIYQSGEADLMARARSDGGDILFTSADGVTKLSHEIEKYTNSTGALVAWIKIPQLSPATDTDIYMYYGNAAAGVQQSPAGVWDNNYIGVWHLGETSGSHYDSTANNNDSTSVAVSQQGAEVGKIDGADVFNGTTDQIHVNDSTSFNFNQAVTVEAWVNPGAIDGTADRQVAGKYQNGYSLSATRNFTAYPVFDVYVNGAFRNVRGSGSLTVGDWAYVAGTYNASEQAIKLFVNGTADGTNNLSGLADYSLGTTTASFRIGRFYSSGFFGGDIDEVRVSNVSRSSDWLTTAYHNQNTPGDFETFGIQTAATPAIYGTSGKITSSILDSGQASSWSTTEFSSTLPTGTGATVKFKSGDSPTDFDNGDFSDCETVDDGSSAADFTCAVNNRRYIQYQVSLTTGDTSRTPTFHEINLNYSAYVSPTPTPVPSSGSSPGGNNGANNFSAASAPACLNSAPGLTAPRIYKISRSGNNAVILAFTAAADPFDHYALVYGNKSGQYVYGVVGLGDRRSSQFEVKGLTPGKTYYFRIRGGNGCAVGTWSEEAKFSLGGKIGLVKQASPTIAAVPSPITTPTEQTPTTYIPEPVISPIRMLIVPTPIPANPSLLQKIEQAGGKLVVDIKNGFSNFINRF